MKVNTSKRNQIILLLLVIWVANIFATGDPVVDDRENIFLQSIPTVLPPEIQDNTIMYTVFFVFEKCPDQQWVYFEKDKSELKIDFYGVHIESSSQVALKGIPVINDFEIRNLETQFSINGKRAQIVLDMDSFWHYKSTKISGEVLRLQIWKYLNPADVLEKESHKARVPILASLIAVSTAALTILILLSL